GVPPDQPEEQPACHDAPSCFAAAAADSPHDVGSGAPLFYEFQYSLRRILQIAGESRHSIAAGAFDSGCQRGLSAEIAREPKTTHAPVVARELFNQLPT